LHGPHRTVLDFNVQIYRYLGPSRKVTVDLYNTQKYLGWMSTFLGISEYPKKQKKTKTAEFDEIYQKSHGSFKRDKGISKRVLG